MYDNMVRVTAIYIWPCNLFTFLCRQTDSFAVLNDGYHLSLSKELEICLLCICCSIFVATVIWKSLFMLTFLVLTYKLKNQIKALFYGNKTCEPKYFTGVRACQSMHTLLFMSWIWLLILMLRSSLRQWSRIPVLCLAWPVPAYKPGPFLCPSPLFSTVHL